MIDLRISTRIGKQRGLIPGRPIAEYDPVDLRRTVDVVGVGQRDVAQYDGLPGGMAAGGQSVRRRIGEQQHVVRAGRNPVIIDYRDLAAMHDVSIVARTAVEYVGAGDIRRRAVVMALLQHIVARATAQTVAA